MSGLDLDEAQELRTLARKQAHLVEIQWRAFEERIPDRELCMKLMEIWYQSTLVTSIQSSMTEGLEGMFAGFQALFPVDEEEDEDEE